MPEEFSLSNIAQVAVTVKDLDRATAFYRDKLGLKHLFQAPLISGFDCGGITMLLSPAEGDVTNTFSSIVYFNVADMQEAFDALSARGVEFIEKPNLVGKLGPADVWIAIFRDSEGNMMGLRSMVVT
jgi:predicted enzyme related to lactoylglutathione lyase